MAIIDISGSCSPGDNCTRCLLQIADICTMEGSRNESCIRPGQSCTCTNSTAAHQIESPISEIPTKWNETDADLGEGPEFVTCGMFAQIDAEAFLLRPMRKCMPFANTPYAHGQQAYVYCDHCKEGRSLESPTCDDQYCGAIVGHIQAWGCGQVQNGGTRLSPVHAQLIPSGECQCTVCKVADVCTQAVTPAESCISFGQNCTCTTPTITAVGT